MSSAMSPPSAMGAGADGSEDVVWLTWAWAGSGKCAWSQAYPAHTPVTPSSALPSSAGAPWGGGRVGEGRWRDVLEFVEDALGFAREGKQGRLARGGQWARTLWGPRRNNGRQRAT